MTCIIGLVDKEKVYIGGDSAGVDGLDYHIREDSKVFKKGDMIFGFTTSFRMGQLLRYSLVIPKHVPELDTFEYLCTLFIDAVIKCFKDNEYVPMINSVPIGGEFILGYKGKIYQIFGSFQVAMLQKSFTSCGCGEAYAKGAMEILNGMNTLTPEQKITEALRVAEQFSAGVKGPFNIVSI